MLGTDAIQNYLSRMSLTLICTRLSSTAYSSFRLAHWSDSGTLPSVQRPADRIASSSHPLLLLHDPAPYSQWTSGVNGSATKVAASAKGQPLVLSSMKSVVRHQRSRFRGRSCLCGTWLSLQLIVKGKSFRRSRSMQGRESSRHEASSSTAEIAVATVCIPLPS